MKSLLRRISIWWYRSLHGYKEYSEDSIIQTIHRHYGIPDYHNYHKPAWWGKIIVFIFRKKLFSKLSSVALAIIMTFIAFGYAWFPSIQKVADSFAASLVNDFIYPGNNQNRKPVEKGGKDSSEVSVSPVTTDNNVPHLTHGNSPK